MYTESYLDYITNPDNKVHGANMGSTCVLSAPDGPHVGPMNLGTRECFAMRRIYQFRIVDVELLNLYD